VTFTPADTADYNSASASVPLTVGKATPTVTWADPAPLPFGALLSDAQLNAAAHVPGTFGYSPATGTLLGLGTHALSVAFAPADTADYNPVTQAATLLVNPPPVATRPASSLDVGQGGFPADPALSANERFVARLYQDLLGRAPEPAGLAAWAGLLDRGQADRARVALGIEDSPEHHLRVVEALYRRLLRRDADPAGLAAWAGFLDAGGTEQQVQAGLLGSAEYQARFGRGTPAGLVEALYADVLGRTPDPAGAQAWGQALAQGATPTAVAAGILASGEAADIAVQALYWQYLGRPAELPERMGWVGQLQGGATDEGVLAGLLGSPEHFQAAQ